MAWAGLGDHVPLRALLMICFSSVSLPTLAGVGGQSAIQDLEESLSKDALWLRVCSETLLITLGFGWE